MINEIHDFVARDVRIPFQSMLALMAEWVSAAVPVVVVLYLLALVVSAALTAIYGPDWLFEWRGENLRF